MNLMRYPRYLFSIIGCCLIFLLPACSLQGNPPGITPGTTPTVTTAPVPPTQTACPAPGTARAAVTAPLALGPHQNLVYLVTEFHGNTPTSTLKRYDVTTTNRTEIIKLPGVSISQPQVSADGQWLLFVASTGQQDKLQMVRMDGQGLQTLYCSSGQGIRNVIWSTNQKLALFSSFSNNQAGIYLLNLASGTIQLELKPTNSGPPLNADSADIPLTWLDNTRAYVSFTNGPIVPIDRLALLDTSRGPNQQMSNLTTVFQNKLSGSFNYPCWDADSSFDGKTLFISQCGGLSAPNCSGSCSLGTREGPSTISTEPPAGGSQRTILTDQTLGIATVRAISANTLLLLVRNFSENHTVDSSHNGLWKVSMDGTGLTRLTLEAKGATTSLCQFTQTPWSNASRDGNSYALETTNAQTHTLSIGSLHGGAAPTSFASISDGTKLQMVGWTTM